MGALDALVAVLAVTEFPGLMDSLRCERAATAADACLSGGGLKVMKGPRAGARGLAAARCSAAARPFIKILARAQGRRVQGFRTPERRAWSAGDGPAGPAADAPALPAGPS